MHAIAIDPGILQRVTAWRGKRFMFDDLDSRRTAHLVVDTQAAFLDPGGELEVPGAREIVPAINAISGAVRVAGGATIFVKVVVHDETRRGLDMLIVSGTVTNCCCESMARDAMQMNYKVITGAYSNAALSDADHNATLNNMMSIFADVMTAAEVIDVLRANAHRVGSAHV